MVYVVFDLDATLADISPIYYYIASLQIKKMLSGLMFSIFPINLERELDKAYSLFVKRILEQEQSDKPIGILRPGILTIMEKLFTLKKKGRISNVIIYSNNSHLESLEFVRDLIHAHIGSKRLISQCIHRTHPLRNSENLEHPNMYPKTWKTLSTIIMNNGTSKIIMAKDVYFFDDLDHIDLQNTLQNNYYKVPEYVCRTNSTNDSRIMKIYSSVLEDAGVNLIQFGLYITDIFSVNSIVDNFILADILSIMLFLSRYKHMSNSSIKETDDGITMMNDMIDRIKMNTIKMTKRIKRARTFKKRRYTQR